MCFIAYFGSFVLSFLSSYKMERDRGDLRPAVDIQCLNSAIGPLKIMRAIWYVHYCNFDSQTL